MLDTATGRHGRSDQPGSSHSPFSELPKRSALVQPPRRPSRERYPVTLERFFELKAVAASRPLDSQNKSRTMQLHDPTGRQGVAPAGVVTAAPIPPPPPPAIIANFAGIEYTTWFPYDAALAAGPTDLLLSVNSSLAISTKLGAINAPINLKQWFAMLPESDGARIFDPRVAYDHYAQRWVLLAAATIDCQQSCFFLSVSQTPDPHGQWWSYALDATKEGNYQTNNWADYPCLGFDDQALYITANMFQFGRFGTFQYSNLRIVPKAAIYAGSPPAWTDFPALSNPDNSMAFTVQPCTTFGSTGTQYLVNSIFADNPNNPPTSVTLWSVTNVLNNPFLARVAVSTTPYSIPPQAQQQNSNEPLDSGDNRILNAVSRNGSVWCALSTGQNWGDGANVAAVHWFEIKVTGSLAQEGIYGAQALHYFYPAILVNQSEDVAMVFARSGKSEFPSAFITNRKSGDPTGTLRASTLLQAGLAPYVYYENPDAVLPQDRGRNRWGDYHAIALDPSDPRQIWCYGGYAIDPKPDGGPFANGVWATRVGGLVP